MNQQERDELEAETIRICQELIRIPSVNYGDGKGDEKAIAQYVVNLLAEVGIVAQSFESAPGRVNVIANIEGIDATRPALVLHGHLDVVPADAADWSVDPFAAVIKEGMIWGRGAVDMKNMDAMMLATAGSTSARLKSSSARVTSTAFPYSANVMVVYVGVANATASGSTSSVRVEIFLVKST